MEGGSKPTRPASTAPGRSQFQTPSGKWVKRDTNTGRILDAKSDLKPFKGVRREK